MSSLPGIQSLKRPLECSLDTLSPDTIRSVLAKQARRGGDIPTSVSVNGVRGAGSLLDPLLAQSGSPARLGYPQHVDSSRICSAGVRRATTGVTTSEGEKFENFKDDMESALRASADDYNMYQTAARIVAIVPSIFLPALQGSGMRGKFRVSHTLQRGDLAFCVRAHDATAMAWLLSDYGWFVQNNSLKMLNLQLLVSLAEVNYILHGLCNNQNADPAGGYQTAWEEFLSAVVGPRHRFLNKGAFEDPQTRLEACSVLVRNYIQPLGMVLACDDSGGHFQFDRLAKYDHGSLCSYGPGGTTSSYTGMVKTPTSNVVTLAVDGLVDIVDDGGFFNPVLGQNAGDEVGLVLVEWQQGYLTAPQSLSDCGILPESLKPPTTNNNESSFTLHIGPDPSSYIHIPLLSSTSVELVPCSSVVGSRLQSLYDVNVSGVYGLWHLFTLQQNVAARPVGEHTINASYRATRSRYGGDFNSFNNHHRKPGQLARTGRASVEAVFTPVWESAYMSSDDDLFLMRAYSHSSQQAVGDVDPVPKKRREMSEREWSIIIQQFREWGDTEGLEDTKPSFASRVTLITTELQKYKITAPRWDEDQPTSNEDFKRWLEETYSIIRKKENSEEIHIDVTVYYEVCNELDSLLSYERKYRFHPYEAWRASHGLRHCIEKFSVVTATSIDPKGLLTECLQEMSKLIEPVEISSLLKMSVKGFCKYASDLTIELSHLFDKLKCIYSGLTLPWDEPLSLMREYYKPRPYTHHAFLIDQMRLYLSILHSASVTLEIPDQGSEEDESFIVSRDIGIRRERDYWTRHSISTYKSFFPVLYTTLQNVANDLFSQLEPSFRKINLSTPPESKIESRITWMREYASLVFSAIAYEIRRPSTFNQKLFDKIPFVEVLCEFLDMVEYNVVDPDITGITQGFHEMRLHALMALHKLQKTLSIYVRKYDEEYIITEISMDDARILSSFLGLEMSENVSLKNEFVDTVLQSFLKSVRQSVERCTDLIDPQRVNETHLTILHRIILTVQVEIDNEYHRLSKYYAYMRHLREKAATDNVILYWEEEKTYEAFFDEIELCRRRKGIYRFVKRCRTGWDSIIDLLKKQYFEFDKLKRGKNVSVFAFNKCMLYFQEVSDDYNGFFGSAISEKDVAMVFKKAYELKLILLKEVFDVMLLLKKEDGVDDEVNQAGPSTLVKRFVNTDPASIMNEIYNMLDIYFMGGDNVEDLNKRSSRLNESLYDINNYAYEYLERYCAFLDMFESVNNIPHWSPAVIGLTRAYNCLWAEGLKTCFQCLSDPQVTQFGKSSGRLKVLEYAKKTFSILSEYTTPPLSPLFFYDHILYEKNVAFAELDEEAKNVLDSYYDIVDMFRELIITCENDDIKSLRSYGPRSRPPYYERMLQSLTNKFTKSFTK